MTNRPWITFFSQTGSEIASLIDEYNRYPDAVITNCIDNSTFCKAMQKHIDEGCPLIRIPQKPEVDDYENILMEYKNPLITLHGFLRIIPPDICKKYEIYNLHPGLITEYPELKGKDPQLKAFKLKHQTAGCVIHRVIPEVDSGEIKETYSINVEGYSIDRLYMELKHVGFILWKKFLKNYE
jgi:folate-dependent phosphoribosylglycinamide formyltransferase PurN